MAELSLDNIRITASSCQLDFKQARRLAEVVIRGMVRAPQLIAWRDTHKDPLANSNSTIVDFKTHDRGVRVDINDEEYSFIFTEAD